MRCLGFVVFLNLIRAALFLTGKDGSVCNVQLSYMESRYVPYTETYKIRKWTFFHQTRSRTNYRIDHVPVWKLEERCCDGYEDRNNVCEPVCSPECVNGKCTSPNLCECDIGYSSVTQYECEPLCTTYCTNGFCARPNECSCNAGYELTESKLYCLPVCTQDCANRNAHCTEPNRCTCNWGYRQSDIDGDLPSCTPICEIPCVNGNCTEPNVCTCNPGYEEDIDRFVCKPKCERICLNGKCTAPNVCTCDPGYQLNENGECEPNCTEPCVMGTCIAPDVCSCYPGYGLPDDSRYVCEAVCEKACVNGTCTAPDVCTCHDGYRATGDDTMSHVCEPVCELPCEPRGHCAAPNTCNCIQGYRMIDMTAKENEVVVDTIVSGCEPVCDQDCANGTCTEPNICTCNDGFKKDADDRCEPVCVSCHNGSCVAPDVCQCWEGFVRTEEFGCAPSCENGCENGECVAPNECVCHEGFESSGNNSDSTCVEHVPTCTTACKGHGVCVEDEKPCECSYGWTGPECDQSTLCILVINPDDENLIGITIRNDTNSTLTNAKRYAPLCYGCDGRTNNESYCFAINDSSIGCFVETVESSCHRDELNAEFKMQTGMLETVIILIVVVVTIACFVIYRHRRKKMRLAIVQNVLQETMANEYLISERDDGSAY